MKKIKRTIKSVTEEFTLYSLEDESIEKIELSFPQEAKEDVIKDVENEGRKVLKSRQISCEEVSASMSLLEFYERAVKAPVRKGGEEECK